MTKTVAAPVRDYVLTLDLPETGPRDPKNRKNRRSG
jgi:hypothetical protein